MMNMIQLPPYNMFLQMCEESNKFSYGQLKQIKRGCDNGLSLQQVCVYAKPYFDTDQMAEIRKGYEDRLTLEQVNLYADPKFNWRQMGQIRQGFEKGLSVEQVSIYAKSVFTSIQMYKISTRLLNKNMTTDEVISYAMLLALTS